MINSRQRAQLRGMANTLETILYVGKNGIGENLVSQANGALLARELIKGKVLDNSPVTAQEAVSELAALCGAEPVQAIGSKFVLYRANDKLPKDKRIRLVK
jgi:RNA-binding protein